MRSHYLAGMVMTVLLAAFFGTAVRAVGQGLPAPNSWDELLRGSWATRYEDSFNKSVPTYDPSKTAWARLNFALFREGNEGVLVGRDGWLFSKEEFDYGSDRLRAIENNIAFITQVHDRLAAHKTRLLVVPVPAKARICREMLGRYRYPAYNRGLYEGFERGLGAAGIKAVDLLTPFEQASDPQALFLKTDTHWTPGAARLAALAVAAYIRENDMALPGPKALYQTVRQERGQRRGDLARYVPVGFTPETVEGVETIPLGTMEDASSAAALFSDDTPAVTLVGTSYSANRQWNFDGYLKEFLQTDVLNAAHEGLGPFETMKKYLADGAFRQNPPALVIWEIPERYLTVAGNPNPP